MAALARSRRFFGANQGHNLFRWHAGEIMEDLDPIERARLPVPLPASQEETHGHQANHQPQRHLAGRTVRAAPPRHQRAVFGHLDAAGQTERLDAFALAMNEHRDRRARLESVMDEVEQLAESISDQC
jgi:hypothetical protein